MSEERPLKILWVWLDWWRIKHAAIQRIQRTFSPILGLIGAIFISIFPEINIFGANGLIYLVNGLIPVLAGFYVASLAAVATFNRPQLDDVMGGIAPRLNCSRNPDPLRLTRRHFLCILFGYLAGATISLYIVGAISILIAPVLPVPDFYRHILKSFFSFIFLSAVSEIVMATFVGLYFLIDRIHRDTVKTGFLDTESSKN